ncbi:hypothetical protein ACLKA7_016399 [Drosophila subpalustris]
MEFTARRNCGAYLNEAPIRASGQTWSNLDPRAQPPWICVWWPGALRMDTKSSIPIPGILRRVFSWAAGVEFDLKGRRVLAAATLLLGSQMVELLGDLQIYHPRGDEPSK